MPSALPGPRTGTHARFGIPTPEPAFALGAVLTSLAAAFGAAFVVSDVAGGLSARAGARAGQQHAGIAGR